MAIAAVEHGRLVMRVAHIYRHSSTKVRDFAVPVARVARVVRGLENDPRKAKGKAEQGLENVLRGLRGSRALRV